MLKKGEYIRQNGIIAKIKRIGKELSIKTRKKTNIYYLDNEIYHDEWCFWEDDVKTIKKHSFDIIDLIEVRRFCNIMRKWLSFVSY